MKNDTVVSIDELETTRDALTEVQRERAQKLIAEAVQAELEELLEQYEGQEDGQGRQRLVRNGYLPQREVQTGIGGALCGSHGFETGDPGRNPKRSSAFAPAWCRPI